MAVANLKEETLICLSTDIKPIPTFEGQALLEVDTKKVFIWLNGNWYEQ